MLQVVILQT